MRVKRSQAIFRTAFVVCLLARGAHAQVVKFAVGNYQPSLSQIVPNTATTVIPAMPGTNGTRSRIVAIDTAIQGGTATTVTVWCAWGTSQANAAVVGTNGFPLNPGIDDNGPGVNQSALNCIQPSGTHYVRLEQY